MSIRVQQPALPSLRWAACALLALVSSCASELEDPNGTGGGSGGSGGGPILPNSPIVGMGPGGPTVDAGFVPQFSVRNDAAFARTETVLASVPLPFGRHANADGLTVGGHSTAWRVLQRWHDGTIRIAQAQFTPTLAPSSVTTFDVVAGAAMTGAFQAHPWVQQAQATLTIGAEVRDTFGVAYRSFVTGTGEVLAETPLVRVRRHRAYHYAVSGGIGRDYLSSTYYVTEHRDLPIVTVDWVLGNDYLGSDSPSGSQDPNHYVLGGVDVNEARFLVGGGGAWCFPYRAAENAIEGWQQLPDGLASYRVLANDWIDDAQTRRYRFQLATLDQAQAQSEQDAALALAGAMVGAPLFALPTQATAMATGSLGLLGGPLAGPADAYARADGEFNSWLGGGWFGTWGTRGDAIATATTGTPRNHPLSPDLAHAVQSGHHRLLIALEQKAWIQAARPYHLYGLQCADTAPLFLWDGVPLYPGSRDLSFESLGRRALYANDPYAGYRTRVNRAYGERAHRWEHFDHEHFSMDLLFDYWSLSGDCWAQEEIRQLGQSLKALMRVQSFNTRYIQAVRAEGWCMQAFVQAYLATGDVNLKNYAFLRTRDTVDAQRRKTHASMAMAFQGNYGGTGWPMNHEFYMPWQHGAVLFGYLGAYRHFADPLYLRIAEDVVGAVEYAWVRNYRSAQFGLVTDGLRYYVATTYNGAAISASHWDAAYGIRFGDGPLGGAHTFLTTGMFLLADHTLRSAVRNKAIAYASLLRQGELGTRRWDKWHFCIPEHFAQ